MPLTTHRWSEDDIAKIKTMAQRKSRADIAAALGDQLGRYQLKHIS